MKITWEKGIDFCDGLPRYSISGLDMSNSCLRFRIGITTERKCICIGKYALVYTPYLYDMHNECEYISSDITFRKVAECKKYIINLIPEVLKELNVDLYTAKYWENY